MNISNSPVPWKMAPATAAVRPEPYPVTRRAQGLLIIGQCLHRMLQFGLGSTLTALPLLYRKLLRGVAPLLLTAAASQPLQAADVSITVENILDVTGTLFWSVYDSEKHYDSDGAPIAAGQNRVIDDSLQVTLHDLPPGEYAVRLFHDANDNGEMDSNVLGLPQEGYGFSNNAGSFGPASFSDAKVLIQENTEIVIQLR